MPFDDLGVQGPMGRTVGDVALMLDAMAGHHIRDPLSLPAPKRPFVDAVDSPAAPRRVAFSPDLGIAPVDQEVRAVCRAAADRFVDIGADLESDCIDFSDAEEIFQAYRARIFATSRGQLLVDHRDQLKPEVIWNIEKGLALTFGEIRQAERGRAALYARVCAFFERYDLLVCPTVVAPPFDHTIRYLEQVGDVAYDNYVGWLVMTLVITLTACPAISVPCGFTATGLPIGLQIVGPPRGDAAVLSAAALFEQAAGLAGAVPIDPRPTAVPQA
jgi:amidase